MVAYRPHRFIVRVGALSIAASGGKGQASFDPANRPEIWGQLQPKTTQEAFEMFGLEAAKPAALFFNIADARKLKVGDYLEIKGGSPARFFRVVSPVIKKEQWTITDHAYCLLEEVANAPD